MGSGDESHIDAGDEMKVMVNKEKMWVFRLGQIYHLMKKEDDSKESSAFLPNLKGIKIDQMEEFSFLLKL